MADTIYAQEATSDTNRIFGDFNGDEYRLRQSFTLSETQTITRVILNFGANGGSPSGQVTCRIETDNAGQASGTLAHANATLAFTPSASADNEVNFTDFSLNSGTYWIVMNCDNQSTGVYWTVNALNTGDYAGGHAARTTNGTWEDLSPQDFTFAVYVLVIATTSGNQGYSYLM